jgi:hypothetical protein
MKSPHPKPKALTFKTRLFGTAHIVTGTYRNGGLAVEIVDDSGEPIATLSVNMPERTV